MLLLNSPASVLAGSSEDDVAMLVDVTKCVGCWWCYAACKQVNGLPDTIQPDPEDPPSLASDVWTTLHTVDKEGGVWAYRKLACNHCTDAACVKVCPTGAVSYNDMGFVQYDKDKCSGCGYCAEFCPFEIPQFERNSISSDALMYKCTFCKDRVINGEQPACAEACPQGAIKFGKRSELVEEGKSRVEEYNLDNPSVAHSLYGESDLGGLHVMYVLDDSPKTYGLPANPELSSGIVIRDVLKWVGIGATGVALAGFGLNYVVARKTLANQVPESESEEGKAE